MRIIRIDNQSVQKMQMKDVIRIIMNLPAGRFKIEATTTEETEKESLEEEDPVQEDNKNKSKEEVQTVRKVSRNINRRQPVMKGINEEPVQYPKRNKPAPSPEMVLPTKPSPEKIIPTRIQRNNSSTGSEVTRMIRNHLSNDKSMVEDDDDDENSIFDYYRSKISQGLAIYQKDSNNVAQKKETPTDSSSSLIPSLHLPELSFSNTMKEKETFDDEETINSESYHESSFDSVTFHEIFGTCMSVLSFFTCGPTYDDVYDDSYFDIY